MKESRRLVLHPRPSREDAYEVTSILKVFGMVNCAPAFNNSPTVIDGCSDLLVEVFGEEVGRHARSAIGMAELPLDIPLEIEMVVAVEG